MTQASTPRVSAEELPNSLTHGVGLILSIAGFATLLSLAVTRGSAWRIVSCTIYCASRKSGNI
jgi:hemolysin III